MNAIDTNVLIYAVDEAEQEKQPIARRLLDQLERDALVVVHWQVLGEFARWLTAPQQEEVDTKLHLDLVRASFPLSMPTPAILDQALELRTRYSLSHWDSMLLGACFEAHVATLYTEDMGAARTINSAAGAELALVNPFEV